VSQIKELDEMNTVTELFCAVKANARQAPPKLPRSFHRSVICHGNGAEICHQILVEEGMKGVEVIDKLNQHDAPDGFQGTHVY
jgi:hypothetical protein